MKNKFIVSLILGIEIIAICVFALLPLFHSGYFTMHDDEQIARLQQMYLVLSQGQIPPRWIPDLGFGFGYPLFNFYPPLVYYLGSLFHLLGFTFINSTKIIMGLGFVLSAGAMFVWVRKHYGLVPALFAAILYTYAPYHSVDLYVRGALAEFFSWVFVPLIFWATDMVFERQDKRSVILLGLFLGLLMLSHTLVMLQLAPLFTLYVVLLLILKKENRLKKLLFVLFAGILGLGLTSYFWLPSILEKQYTLVDAILTKELASYALHFVCPSQLWNGIWGYGGSVPGCGLDGLSFQIGKIQAIVGFIGVFLSTFFMFKRRKNTSFFVAVLFLCSIFLTLSYSKFLWDIAKPFWYIQFPWRYLLFVAVGSAFLGGYVIWLIQNRFGRPIAIFVAVLLSLFAVFQVRNYFQPQSYRLVSDADMTSRREIQWKVSNMSYEYVPKEEPTRLSAQKTTELVITQYGGGNVVLSYGNPSSNMKVKEIENKSYLKKYEVIVYNTKLYNSAIFQVNTYLFPGWVVYIDGKRQTKLIDNYFHLIQVEIPAGKHVVVAEFTNTPVRLISNIISLVTLVGLVVFVAVKKYKK